MSSNDTSENANKDSETDEPSSRTETAAKQRKEFEGKSAKELTSQGYAICFFPEQPRRIPIPSLIPVLEEVREIQELKLEGKLEQHAPVEPLEKSEAPGLFKTSIYKEEAIASDHDLAKPQTHWRNRLLFYVAFISFSPSLYNAYNFPLNIYKFGPVFLIPYTIFTATIGLPLFWLQTSMGQFRQKGILKFFDCAPFIRGIGIAILLICTLTSIYYNMFAVYSLVYFSRCFNKILPWMYCSEVFSDKESCAPRICGTNCSSPAKHYFYHNVLNSPKKIPVDLELGVGALKWWTGVTLVFVWCTVYVATMKSVRSIEKFATFIAIFSYFAMLMLLMVAMLLKGSSESPQKKIGGEKNSTGFSFEMWSVAGSQVILELGICYGVPLVYGSYCHFRNHVFMDSLALSSLNYLHSIYFFCLFFMLSGSFCNGKSSLDDSFGAIFIIYSETFARIHGGHLWCAVFFFMLFCIIVGTQIAVSEVIMSALCDCFDSLSKRRVLVNILICFVFTCLGVIFCSEGGFFLINFLHTMPIFYLALPVVFLFLAGFLFVYGLDKYLENVETMLGYNPGALVKVVLRLTALLVLVLTVFSLAYVYPSKINNTEYAEPLYVAGWVLIGIVLMSVFVWSVVWIICKRIKSKTVDVRRSDADWQEHCDRAKYEEEDEVFTEEYDPSFTSPWREDL